MLLQEQAWRELLLAAIGEQLSEHVAPGDEICGVTISARREDDLLQVWNVAAKVANKATVLKAIHKLLPDTSFTAEFYKCMLIPTVLILVCYCC